MSREGWLDSVASKVNHRAWAFLTSPSFLQFPQLSKGPFSQIDLHSQHPVPSHPHVSPGPSSALTGIPSPLPASPPQIHFPPKVMILSSQLRTPLCLILSRGSTAQTSPLAPRPPASSPASALPVAHSPASGEFLHFTELSQPRAFSQPLEAPAVSPSPTPHRSGLTFSECPSLTS